MRSAVTKKARLDEKQNQTTTANINYIQNFMSIKKINNKIKIASDNLIVFKRINLRNVFNCFVWNEERHPRQVRHTEKFDLNR